MLFHSIQGAGSSSPAVGEAVFILNSSRNVDFSWTVPAGVTSISALAIGGGGGGGRTDVNNDAGNGGGGGGLAYVNNWAVTPGESLNIRVGSGGAYIATGSYQENGNQSYVRRGTGSDYACRASGGTGGTKTIVGVGGTYLNGTGGSGGNGGTVSSRYGGGGGGAAGYSGNGGNGGGQAANGANGSGGGGGGGAGGNFYTPTGYQYYCAAGSGGGTGIYGAGSSGAGGVSDIPTAYGGGAGSNGLNGYSNNLTGEIDGGVPYNVWDSGAPGLYGAGGGGNGVRYRLSLAQYVYGNSGGAGHGVVRIIWGSGRSFPSTNCDLASSLGNIQIYA